MIRRWPWFAGGLLVGALITLGVLWLMFQHIPSWYDPRPAPADEDRLQSIRDDFVGTTASLEDWLVQAEGPFEFPLSQDQINAWLAARREIWPRSRHWLPANLTDPFVAIDEDGVRLAATYHYKGIRSVVSGLVSAEAGGQGIQVKLEGISAGSLPMPISWAERRLKAADAEAWSAGGRAKTQVDGPPLPPLANLTTGQGAVFPRSWYTQLNKIPFRVNGIRFEPGLAVIEIEPLPRETQRR